MRDNIMPDKDRRKAEQERPRPGSPQAAGSEAGRPPKGDPAVERGERLDTGKTIARGGKSRGRR